MRFIGSLIKYAIYLVILVIAASAALFWFDTGDWLVRPLASRAGNYFLAPMKLDFSRISGSLRRGYTLEGLTLSSGDQNLLTLDYASVSPDWDSVMAGMDGLPFVKSLNLRGISSDLDKVMIIANHFASPEDSDSDDEDSHDEDSLASTLRLRPFSLNISDVNFATPYAALSLDAITLNPDGALALDSRLISRDNVLPLRTKARVNFAPLEIISSDLLIGQKGTGKFSGVISPLKANLSLTCLSLEELLKFAPDLGVQASGRIDARLAALIDNSGNLNAAGILSMPRANVMDVPLNFRLPFTFDGGKTLVIDNATLNTKVAAVKLNAKTDLEAMTIKAKGEALNISLNEIGRMFAPEAGLYGEGGNLKFDIDALLEGDILGSSRADVTASLPQVTAAGVRIVKDLSAHVKLDPGRAPRVSLNGEVFKGKLFARGEAAQDSLGNIKPKAIVSVVNLDVPTLLNTFPELAKSVEKPSGRITARAEISDTMNVDGRITSDRLSAFGVTLTNLLAEGKYLHGANRAELERLSANLGKGKITASGGASLRDERFSFRADAENVDLRAIPQLKDVKGTYSLTAQGSGKYTDPKSIKAEADITAKNAGYDDFVVNSATIPVNFSGNVLTIRDGVVALPKGGNLRIDGNADLNASTFGVTASAQNIDPRFIVKDLAGTYSLNAEASGKFTDVDSIRAKADLTARNVAYSGMALGNVNVPVSFANNTLKINGARAALPGGAVTLTGSVGLKNPDNPMLDLSASTKGVDLTELFRRLKLDVPASGNVWGVVTVKGPLYSAGVNAAFKAENVKAAGNVNIPSAELKLQGNTKRVNVTKLEATVNDVLLRGNGVIGIDQRDIMNSNLNVQAKVSRLNLKKTLSQFMENPPVSGIIRGDIALRGNINEPALDVKLNSPVNYGKTEIHDIALRLRAPEQGHYAINAKARIEEFVPEVDVDLRDNNGIWMYHVKTKPLDVDKAIQTQMPEMAGMVKGFVNLDVKSSTKPNADVNVNVRADNIRLMDKVDVEDISLPTAYRPSVNKIELKKARAILSDGMINSGFEYDLNKSTWNGNLKVVHLDFGKLANKFLPEGELIGKVDAELSMKGQQGMMSTSFANGKFSTTSGYLHKMAILDKITPTKRISFEKIAGTFFWNGSDLFLNPGTRAKAGPEEPMYRYVDVNGALGLPGKGLKLMCDGRFDLKILDQFLGAMKGVFQYMTGSLARDVIKDAASRVLGVKRKDFQNVSFTLANSWQEPQLLELKITKPIEDFLPIDILNRNEEKQKDDAQFKMRLNFPVGPGHKSVEDESAEDQLKEQMIDNLFNLGL